MPHDRNGKQIKNGDRVALYGVASNVSANETACNVSVQVEAPDGEYAPQVTCNTRSCEVLESE